MFDIGMSELLVIGTVALIVIGPKDLPEAFRQVGRFTAKARAMGREFNRAMEQAARESGVKDVASDLNKIANPRSMGLDAMKAAADKFEKWDPVKAAAARTAPKAAPTAGEAAADSAEAALEERTLTASSGLAPAAPPAAPVAAPSTVPSAAPAAAVAEVVPPATVGPETRALYEKQAAKKKVIADSVAQLKAIDAGAAPTDAKPAARTGKSRAPGTTVAESPVETGARAVTGKKAAAPAREAASPAPARKSRKKDAE
jgi:sec-independent protein translocase protein TatB